MSTFISNTATENLLLPIMATLGTTVSTLGEIGSSKLLDLLMNFSCLPSMAYQSAYLQMRWLMQQGY